MPAINAFKKVIGRYSKPYNPDNYPNPALNFHYETLAALALNQALPEPVDKTLPAYKVLDSRAGEAIEAFKKALGQEEKDGEEEEELKPWIQVRGPLDDEMRRWAGVLADKGQKKVTLEVRMSCGCGLGAVRTGRAMLTEYVFGVPLQELKQMSKGLGEKVSGTKGDLWDRVTGALHAAGFWAERVSEAEGEGEGTPRKKARR